MVACIRHPGADMIGGDAEPFAADVVGALLRVADRSERVFCFWDDAIEIDMAERCRDSGHWLHDRACPAADARAGCSTSPSGH